MARQNIDFTTSALNPPNAPVDDGLDTGTKTDVAVRPIVDGEPAQGAVFKRPSENLRTRTEIIREELEQLKFMSDADKAMLLTSTGDITWNGLPTGTFVPTQNLVLKPFLAPSASTAAKLIICAGTQAEITIRTRQNGASGQPRAYSGANDITIDLRPLTVGDGSISVTTTGDGNRVHIRYDDHPISGTTAGLNSLTGFIQQFNASSVAITLGLEAVSFGTGTPVEGGNRYPAPPAFVANSLIKDYIVGVYPLGEHATRFLAGAAEAEKHIITPGNLTAFFGADGGTLNKLIEGDVLCIWYDEMVGLAYGGRRQSLSEAPESSATIPSGSLFMLRRFPERLPGALPIATVVNGQLIFVSGRVYNSGETGPLVSSGASYQGSGPWQDGNTIAAGSFESAVDAIVSSLAAATVPSGAQKVGIQAITGVGAAAGTFSTLAGGVKDAIAAVVTGANAHINLATAAHAGSAIANTPAGNIASTTVQAAINELDTEKAAVDRAFVVYGDPGSLSNALRVDGETNAGTVVGGLPFTLKAGDNSTKTLVLRRYLSSGQNIQDWQTESGASLASVDATGLLSLTNGLLVSGNGISMPIGGGDIVFGSAAQGLTWPTSQKIYASGTTGLVFQNVASGGGQMVVGTSSGVLQLTAWGGTGLPSVILETVFTGTAAFGTSSNHSLDFATNNSSRWRILNTGELGAVGANREILNVLDPINPQDAATKNYVDQLAAAGGNMVQNGGFNQTSRNNVWTITQTTGASVERRRLADRWWGRTMRLTPGGTAQQHVWGVQATGSVSGLVSKHAMFWSFTATAGSAWTAHTVHEFDREEVLQARGQKITFSAAMFHGLNFTGPVRVSVFAGTGGTLNEFTVWNDYSGQTEIYREDFTIIGSWARYAKSAPSIDLIVPTNATTMALVFEVSSTNNSSSVASNNFYFTDVSVLSGITGHAPDKFVFHGGSAFADTLACQQYVESNFTPGSWGPGDPAGGAANVPSGNVFAAVHMHSIGDGTAATVNDSDTIPFRVIKKYDPWANPLSTLSVLLYQSTNPWTLGSVTIQSVGNQAGSAVPSKTNFYVNTAGVPSGASMYFYWVADCDFGTGTF